MLPSSLLLRYIIWWFNFISTQIKINISCFFPAVNFQMKHGQILSFISPYSVELNLQYFNINCDKTRYLLGQSVIIWILWVPFSWCFCSCVFCRGDLERLGMVFLIGMELLTLTHFKHICFISICLRTLVSTLLAARLFCQPDVVHGQSATLIASLVI